MKSVVLVAIVLGIGLVIFWANQPQQTPTEPPLQSKVVFFNNCTEARAAGYSNIREGEPGYAIWLDRDRDGIGCER